MNDLLKIFHALSDETRLKIIKILSIEELCVCELVAVLNIVQPKISFHLGILKDAGLLKSKKEGKWIIYELKDDDLFIRFLILSVIEKISDESVADEIERLKNLRKNKLILKAG